MTAQLLRAKEAGADVILTYGIGPELAQIANGQAKLGWKVPMIGSWTLAMSSFIDNAGPNGEGASMPQTFVQVPNTPKRSRRRWGGKSSACPVSTIQPQTHQPMI